MIQEIRNINGTDFRYTCASEGVLIRKIGTDELYSEAYDVMDSGYEYEETDIPIEPEPTDEQPDR